MLYNILMYTERVIFALKQMCPGKKIMKFPDSSPSEILCEQDPTDHHESYSIAIAVIDKSAPHKHVLATEVYEIIKGTLTLHVDGKKHLLKEGEQFTILPGTVHYAEGDETWVKVLSKPGWKATDHILIDKPHKHPKKK